MTTLTALPLIDSAAPPQDEPPQIRVRAPRQAAEPGLPVRVRVLVGEDADVERRGDKKPIAMSDVRYRCRTAEQAEQVIEALRESDEKLRNRPEELMLWDWQSTYWEAALDSPDGGGTVILGVAWYDPEFYAERRDAGFSVMHRRIYDRLGLTAADIKITHWRIDNNNHGNNNHGNNNHGTD